MRGCAGSPFGERLVGWRRWFGSERDERGSRRDGELLVLSGGERSGENHQAMVLELLIESVDEICRESLASSEIAKEAHVCFDERRLCGSVEVRKRAQWKLGGKENGERLGTE